MITYAATCVTKTIERTPTDFSDPVCAGHDACDLVSSSGFGLLLGIASRYSIPVDSIAFHHVTERDFVTKVEFHRPENEAGEQVSDDSATYLASYVFEVEWRLCNPIPLSEFNRRAE